MVVVITMVLAEVMVVLMADVMAVAVTVEVVAVAILVGEEGRNTGRTQNEGEAVQKEEVEMVQNDWRMGNMAGQK